MVGTMASFSLAVMEGATSSLSLGGIIIYAYSRFHTSYNLDRYTVIQVKSYT